MVKAAWGKKHTCPKCSTRFYDLGKKGPVVCIECEHKWVPEQILKAKQVHVAPPKPAEPEAKKPADEVAASVAKEGAEGAEGAKGKENSESGDSDAAAIKGLEVKVEDDGSDENSGILGDVSLDDDKEDLTEVVDTKLEKSGGE